ncbi:methyltransferase domain-containing protein [Sphingomonas sp.]|uniref:methyltransferase domain-containing protein n=1 Tax=Sphingomonas sp. TaxID=28214 RepID=UPI003B00024B
MTGMATGNIALDTRASGECNICGSLTLLKQRRQAICVCCRSDARTRLMWLLLTSRDLLRRGMRVLHLAPECAIAGRLAALVGDGYEPADINPAGFPDVPGIRKLDLTVNASALPSGHYNVIIHSHVMEHVRCNVTAVLYHLHRALTPNGKQVCSIPISRDGNYAEDLSSMIEADEAVRFGQSDHVRRFAASDIQLTLGMTFRLPREYNLYDEFSPQILDRFGIHGAMRTGWSPSSVLVLGKDDLLLTT